MEEQNDKNARKVQEQGDPLSGPVKTVVVDSVGYGQHGTNEDDAFSSALRRRVQHLCEALDTAYTGYLDAAQLGALLSAVGCCPTESQLRELMARLEEQEEQEARPGQVSVRSAQPLVLQCVEDRRYRPATSEQLRQAFSTITAHDEQSAMTEPQEQGAVLTQARLVRLLTEEGEHFSQEEVEEMLTAIPIDARTGGVNVEEYIKMLVVSEMW